MATPAPKPPADYEDHIGASRQYMRDIILGVNDGLVSTFLLVSGVVGGGLTTAQVLLTGVAAAIAGMISMGTGEYLATKSQDEVFAAEMELEAKHLAEHRDHERDELRHMFGDLGIEGADLNTLVNIIDSKDEAMMSVMAGMEFGIVETERRNPYLAAFASAGLFLLGALPSIVPFALTDDPGVALVAAGIGTGVGLFLVGAVKTLHTKKSPLVSGLENLAIGLIGGLLAFGVGRLFNVTIAG